MRKENDIKLARSMVLAVVKNETFINEVILLAVGDPPNFRKNLRALILSAFDLKVPKDQLKVEAVLMAINVVVKKQGEHYNALLAEDIRQEQFAVAGSYLIRSFEGENLKSFKDIIGKAAQKIEEQAAQESEDIPPAMEAPKPPAQIKNKGRPLPTVPATPEKPTTVREKPLPPPRPAKKPAAESATTATESIVPVRPPPPSYVPHSAKFASFRSELIAEIKHLDAKYQQFSAGGGLELAKKYLNASNALNESMYFKALVKKLGLDNVTTIVESMVTEALKEKKPLDLKAVQADVKETIGLLQASRDRIRGMDCADAAHVVIDKIIVNLKVQSEVMNNKAEKKTDLINRIMQKREKPSSEKDDTDETPRKRGSGSFKM